MTNRQSTAFGLIIIYQSIIMNKLDANEWVVILSLIAGVVMMIAGFIGVYEDN